MVFYVRKNKSKTLAHGIYMKITTKVPTKDYTTSDVTLFYLMHATIRSSFNICSVQTTPAETGKD
jgi:hypothetical protein